MAATGEAEYMEARRKEVIIMRKAFLRSERQKGMDPVMGCAQQPSGKDNAERRDAVCAPNSYDYQLQREQSLGRRSGGCDPASVDKERRIAHLAQQRNEYSAKLPNRYTSIDYQSQW